MISNFSLRQRLHLLLELLYGECDARMRQEIVFDVVVFEGPDMLAEFGGVSETPPNSASISGPSKTTTSNTLLAHSRIAVQASQRKIANHLPT